TKKIPCDVVLLQVSPPNAKGEYSLGLGVEYLAAAIETARVVIAEVNDQVPWTHTSPVLRKFDLLVKSSRAPVAIENALSKTDLQIAGHAVKLVPEQATIETGIGVLPNAVLAALRGRKGLRMHTGAIPDAAADLGLLSCDGGALMGTQKLFDWA